MRGRDHSVENVPKFQVRPIPGDSYGDSPLWKRGEAVCLPCHLPAHDPGPGTSASTSVGRDTPESRSHAHAAPSLVTEGRRGGEEGRR